MMRVFTDEEALTLLFEMRYGCKPCPLCGNFNSYKRYTGLFEFRCSKCSNYLSPTAGTFMHGTQRPGAWLMIIWLLTDEETFNIKEISKMIELTYSTTHKICTRIKK